MKSEERYEKLIGRIDDEYYFLDYIFENGPIFRGAVGSVMRPVTHEEAEARRNDWDEDGELWRMAVADKRTELGLWEWRQFVLNTDEDDAVFDLSYREYSDELVKLLDDDEIEFAECTGGGRCFDVDMKWSEIFNEKLWLRIKEFERRPEKDGKDGKDGKDEE